MHPGILYGIVGLLILIIILWIAYSVSAAYQQTLTVTVPFDNTYRYVPSLQNSNRYRLDAIKVTVTGSIKDFSTITPSTKIRKLISDTIINKYHNSIIIQESDIFTIDNKLVSNLNRFPIIKEPTVENLSILFFKELAPQMLNIGSQLVSVKLISEDVQVTHSRYKISNYTI